MTKQTRTSTPVKRKLASASTRTPSPKKKNAAKAKRSPAPTTPPPKATPSPRTKLAKQAAFVANHDWRGLFESVNPNKDDFKVRYYFPEGPNAQADRDWVAQAASFYNGRTKRQSCPAAAAVTAQLPNFVQGYTQDLNMEIAPIVTFKAAKHALAFAHYIHENRIQHHNITVAMNLDDSPFLPIDN